MKCMTSILYSRRFLSPTSHHLKHRDSFNHLIIFFEAELRCYFSKTSPTVIKPVITYDSIEIPTSYAFVSSISEFSFNLLISQVITSIILAFYLIDKPDSIFLAQKFYRFILCYAMFISDFLGNPLSFYRKSRALECNANVHTY